MSSAAPAHWKRQSLIIPLFSSSSAGCGEHVSHRQAHVRILACGALGSVCVGFRRHLRHGERRLVRSPRPGPPCSSGGIFCFAAITYRHEESLLSPPGAGRRRSGCSNCKLLTAAGCRRFRVRLTVAPLPPPTLPGPDSLARALSQASSRGSRPSRAAASLTLTPTFAQSAFPSRHPAPVAPQHFVQELLGGQK